MRGVRLAACLASTAMSLFAAGITGAHADNGVLRTHYDGITNDLLTAGLGKTGLGSAIPPASSIRSIRRQRNFADSRSTTTTAPLSTRRRAAATAHSMARTWRRTEP